MSIDPTIEESEKRKLIRELCRLMGWNYEENWYQINTNSFTMAQLKDLIVKIKLGRMEE